tara:strand:- start:23 stop:589 length:567 start_codon:yes stop_codon:yes gene_type:complete
MKITKSQLKEIIKEEIERVLNEEQENLEEVRMDSGNLIYKTKSGDKRVFRGFLYNPLKVWINLENTRGLFKVWMEMVEANKELPPEEQKTWQDWKNATVDLRPYEQEVMRWWQNNYRSYLNRDMADAEVTAMERRADMDGRKLFGMIRRALSEVTKESPELALPGMPEEGTRGTGLGGMLKRLFGGGA